MSTEAMTSVIEADILSRDPSADPVMMSDVVELSPTLIAIKQKETACVDQLESQPRQRRFKSAPDCSNDALTAPPHNGIDFDVAKAVQQVKDQQKEKSK